MKKNLVPFLAALALVGTVYILLDQRQTNPIPTDTAVSGDGSANGSGAESGDTAKKHLVTAEMHLRSAKATMTDAAPISAQADDGTVYDLDDVVKKQPAFLIFIKDKCPCSVAAEPYYQKLHATYGDKVQFLGVIDGDIEIAKGWKKLNKTPFPILLDPELILIKEYQATNSAFAALIDQNRKVIKLWPGFCDDYLKEMGRVMASLVKTPVVALEFPDSPAEPFSGCPFGID